MFINGLKWPKNESVVVVVVVFFNYKKMRDGIGIFILINSKDIGTSEEDELA